MHLISQCTEQILLKTILHDMRSFETDGRRPNEPTKKLKSMAIKSVRHCIPERGCVVPSQLRIGLDACVTLLIDPLRRTAAECLIICLIARFSVLVRLAKYHKMQ